MSQGGASSTRGSGASPIETLTGNSGGAVSPDASFNINILGNNTTGINVVGSPGTNTLSIVGIQATTSQRGTVTLATNAESIAGTDTSKVITPDDLKAKLGTQTNHGVLVGAGTAAAVTALAVGTTGQVLTGATGADPAFQNIGTNSGLTNHGILLGQGNSAFVALGSATDGQLPIGSTGANPVLGVLTAGSGITITNGAGSIMISTVGSDLLNYTTVTNAMTPYSVSASDEYLGVNTTAGVVTILLPNAPSTGRVFYVKDSKGTSAASAITVTTVGGVVNIDAGTSYTINSAYQSIDLIFNGASYEVF